MLHRLRGSRWGGKENAHDAASNKYEYMSLYYHDDNNKGINVGHEAAMITSLSARLRGAFASCAEIYHCLQCP
jgi:hypothetical protein